MISVPQSIFVWLEYEAGERPKLIPFFHAKHKNNHSSIFVNLLSIYPNNQNKVYL